MLSSWRARLPFGTPTAAEPTGSCSGGGEHTRIQVFSALSPQKCSLSKHWHVLVTWTTAKARATNILAPARKKESCLQCKKQQLYDRKVMELASPRCCQSPSTFLASHSCLLLSTLFTPFHVLSWIQHQLTVHPLPLSHSLMCCLNQSL
jgi:hypothetical protein